MKLVKKVKKAYFQDYTCPADYERAGLNWVEPMTAKEIAVDKQDEYFDSEDYYIEEKFDGTRATLHFMADHTRCFSRRVSVKTGWFCENSDSVPHIRDMNIPELEGTVIDGEMFINNRPFRDVASVLNCKWDKAVERQKELGEVILHAFDIVYYKGEDVQDLPLHDRKKYLREVVKLIFNYGYTCVEEVPYYPCGIIFVHEERLFTPRRYYEHIVENGGEGVIIKNRSGKYYQKRGNEYLKIKKFITRDTVIVGFNPPTKEYKGKFPKPSQWLYWWNEEEDKKFYVESNLDWFNDKTYKQYPSIIPVSKHFFEGWIGTLLVGVIVTDDDLLELPDDKEFEFINLVTTPSGKMHTFVIVGEIGGFDEETRKKITDNTDDYLVTTVEVLANDMFPDTGKMRHPRFYRFREDKSPLSCTWKDHVD